LHSTSRGGAEGSSLGS